jgi:beta-lactamase regulating signal transducer with metallopeptidase domain
MDPFGFVLGLGARASVLLGLTALALLALRRASAATRQAVAVAGMAGALALPPLSFALPRWNPALFPAAWIETSAAPVHDALARFLLAGWVVLAWGAVAALSLARLALGMWHVGRCARRGTELKGEPCIARAAGKLGLQRTVRVVLSAEAKVPMTAGLQKPVVILPAEAAGWSSERLELVLLHELAHVKRRDCLAVMVAEIALASWWFHPLARLARQSIRRDAELAADDLVLRAGARPSVYAGHLLAIVRSLRDSRQFGPAMAMGRASDLDGRLRALLERKGPGPSSRWGRGIAAALGALALTLAALWPAHAAPPPRGCELRMLQAASRRVEAR